MKRQIFPLWVLVLVALAIAAAAFGIAQVTSGAGIIFVLAAMVAWVSFIQYRGRRMDRTNG